MTSTSTKPIEDQWMESRGITDTVLEIDEFRHLSLWQAIKKWNRVFLFSLGMTSAILMYGYDYVIVGNAAAMPAFQRDFGQHHNGKWVIPALWLGLWTFISPGGAMVGSLIAGFFQDWYGRKVSLAIGSFLAAVGVAVCFVSNLPPGINDRRGAFLAGKGFQGGAIGMVLTTCQTYMSEVLPPILRGPVLAFFPIFTLLGQLIGSVVIYGCLDLKKGYVICFGTQWLFSVMPIVMAFVVPESPAYLIRRNKYEKAHKAQKRLDAKGIDTEKTLDSIRRNIEHEKSQTDATYAACFSQDHLRRTLIVMFANVFTQAFGLTLLSQASYFGQIVGMSSNISVLVLILGIVLGMLANFASMWVVARIGHRQLALVGLAGSATIWTVMGVGGIWDGKGVVWLTAVLMILAVMSAGLTVWPVSYAIGAETSALHLRAKTQGLGWFVTHAISAIFGFALPYMYNPDQGNLKAKVGFFFGGLCAISFAISFYHIPEMKGRTHAKIDHMFEIQLPARAFRKWSRTGPNIPVQHWERGSRQTGVQSGK